MPATVSNVERFTLVVPLVDRIRREMERQEIHDWAEVEITRATADNGLVGYGETIQHYTWGRVEDEERALGRPPFETMWDDSLGAGLQMALFDLAGKLAGVPVYRLLGNKCRDWCPLSFWGIDMPPEKYAAEAALATKLGYTCMKIKARPWWDVRETVRLIDEATPDHFSIDIDWNHLLLNVSNAVPVLRELERCTSKIKISESPIPMIDVSGNRLLRERIGTAIAHHYGLESSRTTAEAGLCDGYVIGGGTDGGVRGNIANGISSATMHMPFFLQMVGTGLTTSMSLHMGAVLTHAQWPAVNCHELYEHNLLSERIEVLGGYARVPEEPGLGVTVDEEALEKYRVDTPDHTAPRTIGKVVRACGMNIYFAKRAQKFALFSSGSLPVDEWGNWTEYLNDDGSSDFAELYERASVAPVIASD